MKNNKMMKASVASAMLLGLVAPTVLATTNVATAAEEKSAQARSLDDSINAETGNDTITIQSANGIPLNDQKFNAYRLMDAHYVNDEQEGYVIIPAWQDFFNQEVKKGKGKCSNQEAQLYLIAMQNSPEKFKGFKDAVNRYATEKSIKPLGKANAQKDTYTISNLPDGYYAVVQEENEHTVAVSKDMLVTLDGHNQNATIKLKADVPSLLKTINGSITGNEDKKVMDFAIGDEVPFRLVSRVPDMSGFKKDDQGKNGGRYIFEIQDKMSKGLTLNQDSIKVTIGGVKYDNFDLVNAGTTSDGSTLWKLVFGIDNANGNKDQCTVDKDGAKTPSKAGDMKESLSDDDGVFNDPMFNGEHKGQAIQVSYTATLNSDAILGGLGNPNTANVLYSNNPYKPSSTNNTWDSSTHAFTFGLDLTKVDDTKKKLADAEFELQTKAGKKIAVTKSGDAYIVTDKENTEGKNTVVKSNDEGKIIVKGLDAGDYQLVETKAPAGYNLLENPIEFTIKPSYSIDQNNGFEGKLTELTVTGKDSGNFTADKATGMVSTTVVNKAGGLLPKTGGRGIFMLAAIGLALMALATYVLFGRKKATK